ncbi:uncharacterized protein PAC_17143 [Phialocephala subalpina]|uniref:BZIP domain-containing protein n=1 Tax=Phialocephala subalpina TaxID=576137 RepID=A0A1L7XQC4_9HELO|nr:uncharacterized protein PAC_17143 [Phialocephala subalpina]
MSQSVLRFDKPVLTNVWKKDDDWTDLKEKQERKKRQNRLNQRAYRMRNAPKEPPATKRRPFRVERFRITEVPPATSSQDEAAVDEDPPPLGTNTSGSPLAKLEADISQLVDQGSSDSGQSQATPDALVPQDFVPREALALLALDLDDTASSTLSSASAQYLHHLKVARSSPIPEADPPFKAFNILDGVLLQIKEEKPFALFRQKPFVSHFACETVPLNQSVFGVATTAAEALVSLDDAVLKETYFPLSSDHLLHLIHFNVFRALIYNKLMLNTTTSLVRAGTGIVLPSHQNLCEGLTLVRAKPGHELPSNLHPTTNQMSIAHSSWLNMFPFPRMRDNLIRRQQDFNHRDLCNDLFGELFFKNMQASAAYPSEFSPNPHPNPNPAWGAFEGESYWRNWDDDVTAGRKGFVVWGEPWDVNSWEVTPGFLNKWGWTLEGCEELIHSSNRWRAKRDEEPLDKVLLLERILNEPQAYEFDMGPWSFQQVFGPMDSYLASNQDISVIETST